jgi:hypothetical protein
MLRWGANRTQQPKVLKTYLSIALGIRFVSAAGGALSAEGRYTHLGWLPAPDSSSTPSRWGGVLAPSPSPASWPHRQLQPRPLTGGQALWSFDATTGELLHKVPLQGKVAKNLFFLRYV